MACGEDAPAQDPGDALRLKRLNAVDEERAKAYFENSN
jgi:hypothetical protein